MSQFKLGLLRLGFALGGRVAPQRTVNRAGRLFATPFASSRSRAANAKLPTGEMRRGEMLVAGNTIATYAWGDPLSQPYVLLVHGWSSFALRFSPWVSRLRAAGFAVVTFDQPGHGRSTGDLCTLQDCVTTTLAVGRRYGKPTVAIGHSLGAAALTLAQSEDWHAQRMVVISPPAEGRSVHEFHIRQHLRTLGLPCLIVHDMEDREVPWGDGELYARHWYNSRLLTTQGLGHHEVVAAPEVIDAALAFLRGARVGERVVGSPNLPLGVA